MIDHIRVKFFVIFTLMLTLTACSYNPLSDSNHNTGSPVAAATGGAVGLGAAAAAGIEYWPALAAATIGGASIGYYVSTLRFSASGIVHSGGQVYQLGDYVTIEIPADILFDTNSADLLPEAEPVLLSARDVINRYCCQSILISGNSSGIATTRYERKLTEARASVVASFLWANGVNGFQKNSNETRKLDYVGYGNYFPIAHNLNNDSLRANSRIQITLYPTDDQLLIDKKHRVFANMGEIGDPPPRTTLAATTATTTTTTQTTYLTNP